MSEKAEKRETLHMWPGMALVLVSFMFLANGCGEPANDSSDDYSEEFAEEVKSESEEVEELCILLNAEFVSRPEPLCYRDGEIIYQRAKSY